MELIADDKERILSMQHIMNADHNNYGTLIKDYNREYLGRIKKIYREKNTAGYLQSAERMEHI